MQRVEMAASCLPTSACTDVILDDSQAGLSPSPQGTHRSADTTSYSHSPYSLHSPAHVIGDEYYIANEVADAGEWIQRMAALHCDEMCEGAASDKELDAYRNDARQRLEALQLSPPSTDLFRDRGDEELDTPHAEPTLQRCKRYLQRQELIAAAARRRAHLDSVVQQSTRTPVSAAHQSAPPALPSSATSLSRPRSVSALPSPTPTLLKTAPSKRTMASTTRMVAPLATPVAFDSVLEARHKQRQEAREALKRRGSQVVHADAVANNVALVASHRRDARVAVYARLAEREAMLRSLAVAHDNRRVLQRVFRRVQRVIDKRRMYAAECQRAAEVACLKAAFCGWARMAHQRAAATHLRIASAHRLAGACLTRWAAFSKKRRQNGLLANSTRAGFVARRLLRRLIARRREREVELDETERGLVEVRQWRAKRACWKAWICSMERRAVERHRTDYRSKLARRAAELLGEDTTYLDTT